MTSPLPRSETAPATSATQAPDDARLVLANYPFQCDVHTRFADLDHLRHVNNVSMGFLFGEGRLQFNQMMFARAPRPDRFVMVVAQINYRFIGETFYPGAVQIGQGLGRIGRTSFTLFQGLFQNGRCTSLCDTTMVGLDHRTPMPLPRALRDVLTEFGFHQDLPGDDNVGDHRS